MDKPISYKEALKRGDKEGRTTPWGLTYETTEVKWDRVLVLTQTQKVTLRTLGEVELIIPPKLPNGYRMQPHPSWDELATLLHDPNKQYPHEYLFKLEKDLRDLYSLLNYEVQRGDLEDYLGPNYEGYANWLTEVSDEWYSLSRELDKLFCEATGFPIDKGELGLPERMPPSLEDTLHLMLEKLKENQDG